MTDKEIDLSRGRTQLTVLLPLDVSAKMTAAVAESRKSKRQWITDAISDAIKKQARQASRAKKGGSR